MRHAHLTDCGLAGIKHVPYGVHMCNFYRTREELADALVPYFVAGLRKRERCIWIAAEPLRAAGAVAALEASGFDARAAIARGDLVVRDYDEWYAAAGALRGNQVVELWFDEEKRALAAGYMGLRITGNVTFLRPQDWALFMEYEELVNREFQGHRIVTLCTYWLPTCGAAEVFDVMRRHNATVERPGADWRIHTGPG